jgi:hypothetical protein
MIDTLGSHNLFANKFIIGTNSVIKEYTKTSTEEIEALHRWLEFKETDPFMDNYRLEYTQSIQFLKIIEKGDFNDIVKDLHRTFKQLKTPNKLQSSSDSTPEHCKDGAIHPHIGLYYTCEILTKTRNRFRITHPCGDSMPWVLAFRF